MMKRLQRIYMVRHGQTTINAENKLSGHSDPPLSEKGEKQAGALAKLLADEQIDALYASPFQRAIRTAEPLAEERNLKIVTHDDLKEQNFGDWEGKSFTEIFKLIPGGAEGLMRGPFLGRFPAGEGTEAFVARVIRAYRDVILEGNEGKNVALVTHSGVMAILTCHFVGIDPFNNFFRFKIENASVSCVDRYGMGLYHIQYLNRVPMVG